MSKPAKLPKNSGVLKRKQGLGYYKRNKPKTVTLPNTVQTRKADRAVPGWIDNI